MDQLKLERYFAPAASPRGKNPAISVSRRGFRLNKGCLPCIQRKDFCELYFNKKQAVVGLKPYQLETPGSVRISRSKEHEAMIFCTPFIRMLGINDLIEANGMKSRRIRGIWDDKRKMFLLDLRMNEGDVS